MTSAQDTVKECLMLLDIHDCLSEFNPPHVLYYGLSRYEFLTILFRIMEEEFYSQEVAALDSSYQVLTLH
jgi:hypothetical protein